MQFQVNSYTIPEYRVVEFESRIKKLCSKARRMKLPEPRVTETGEVFHPRRHQDGTIKHDVFGKVLHARWVTYSVENDVVALPGWDFIGVVRHMDKGNIIQEYTNLETLTGLELATLERFRDSKPTCDHCNKARHRKETFLVRNQEGETLRVGSTCLVDFTGKNCLAALTFALECSSFREYEEDNAVHRNPTNYELRSLLLGTIHVIKEYGWISATKARDAGVASTADIVRDYMEGQITRRPVFDDELELVDDALHWLYNIGPGDTLYINNLKVACSEKFIVNKCVNLVCSLIPSYKRSLEDQQSKAVMLNSKFIGEVGDKVGGKLSAVDKKRNTTLLPEQDCRVLSCRNIVSAWGPSTIITMINDDGNVIVSWSSGKDLQLFPGDKAKVKGRIKSLDNFQGISRTVLKNTSIYRIEGPE